MAVSAYRGGQLKKNPLLGTALGVDPSRAGERERFSQLHTEAKGMAGKGRAGMESSLARRYARFSETNQAALGSLGGQYRSLQDEARGLRDPDREAELAENISTREGRIERFSGKKGRKLARKRFKKDVKSGKISRSDAIKHWGERSKYIQDRAQTNLGTAKTAQQTYETGIADSTKALQGRGQEIEGEMERRTSALHQRISDYNLFLGQA
jgi:hypothetical protein